jgi:DNA primase
MPLDWDELDGELAISDFTIQTAAQRLDRVGDLFHHALEDKQDLMPAIEAVSRFLS